MNVRPLSSQRDMMTEKERSTLLFCCQKETNYESQTQEPQRQLLNPLHAKSLVRPRKTEVTLIPPAVMLNMMALRYQEKIKLYSTYST